MKISQEMIGTMVSAGQTGMEKSSAVRRRQKESANAGRSAQAEQEGVRVDVSQGRSRVARILQQEMGFPGSADDCGSIAGQLDPQTMAGGLPGESAFTQNVDREAEMPEEEAAGQTGDAETGEEVNGQGYSEKDIEYMERMLQSLRESRTSQTNTSTKKKLNYSYRKVSGAIMRAKNRMQAASALSSAKSQLAALKRKAGSGQYEDTELQIAITHASKMVRTARKKASHLKWEEAQGKSDQDTVHSQERKNKAIAQKQDASEKAEVQADLDQQVIQLKKKLKQLTKLEKNENRRTENYELLEADMEYLKKKIDLMRQDQTTQNKGIDQSGMVQTAGTEAVIATAGTEQQETTDAASAGGETVQTAAADQISAV